MFDAQPLGMDDTGFYQEGVETDYENWATPYARDFVGGEPDELVPTDYEDLA